MSRIIHNVRFGAIGTDIEAPLKPMRREEDRLTWLRDDPDHTLYTRRDIAAARRFCFIFAGCVCAYLIYVSARLYLNLKGQGIL